MELSDQPSIAGVQSALFGLYQRGKGMRLGSFIMYTAIGLCALGATAQAQTMTVNPTVLVAGQDATITYSNPQRAGETVTVRVDNGGVPAVQREKVQIVLDENGFGTATWRVPLVGWVMANFNAPGVWETTRAIAPPGDATGSDSDS